MNKPPTLRNKKYKSSASDIYDKRLNRTKKYDEVQSVIDTGSSLSRQADKMEEIKANYKYQKNEIFKRIKVATFVRLILQVREINGANSQNNLDDEDVGPSVSQRDINERMDGMIADADEDIRSNVSTRSKVGNFVSGIGERDYIEQNSTISMTSTTVSTTAYGRCAPPRMANNDSYLDKPYLILDVRTQEEYEQCHIIGSYNFPSCLLSRSCNYESKEMLHFKNSEGKIIVMYDDDETICPRVITSLVQRGYDNIFMLSGGLKIAYKYFHKNLVTGRPPKQLINDLKKQKFKPYEYSTHGNNQKLSNDFTFENIEELERSLDMIESGELHPSVGVRRSAVNSLRPRTDSRREQVEKKKNEQTKNFVGGKPWKPLGQ
ncbi:hypothetical protein SNEBB_000819 [Seison nebaliae]|nr:hypothetical protein SNEBB_000819 [Seison nebaliae]